MRGGGSKLYTSTSSYESTKLLYISPIVSKLWVKLFWVFVTKLENNFSTLEMDVRLSSLEKGFSVLGIFVCLLEVAGVTFGI